MRAMRNRVTRVGSLAGIVGPVLFAAVFWIEGALRPGYDWRSMFVSELALGPRGFIQIANFLVFGTAVILFASALRIDLRSRGLSGAAGICFIIVGAAIFLAGPFVMDPVTVPRSEMTFSGRGHAVSGATVFLGWPVFLWVFANTARKDAFWRRHLPATVAAALVTSALLAVMSTLRMRPGEPIHPLSGLVQRAHILTWCLWTIATSLRLRRTIAAG